MVDAACLNAWTAGSFSIPATGRGPLHGIAVAVKDMFAISGHTPTFGHPRWQATHSASSSTAPLIAALLDAGAHVAGLAKLDQLACSLVGNVGEHESPLNPLHPERFAGGSSSGSASTVAGGLVDVGIGSDTAGSIRVPAAACGLYGLRPTHGLLDATGMIPLAGSFDVPGILAREPTMLARVTRALARPKDATLTQLRLPLDVLAELDDELATTIQAAARSIGDRLDCEVVECEFGAFVTTDVADLLSRLQARELWMTHGAWITENRQYLAPEVRSWLGQVEQMGRSSVTDKMIDKETWLRYQRHYGGVMPPGTAMVLPIISDLPPRRDATPADLADFGDFPFRLAAPSSLTGSPELVVPVTTPGERRRTGVGFLGTRGADVALLTLAHAAAPLLDPFCSRDTWAGARRARERSWRPQQTRATPTTSPTKPALKR